jgi:hypothetical protein
MTTSPGIVVAAINREMSSIGLMCGWKTSRLTFSAQREGRMIAPGCARFLRWLL